MIRRGTRVVGTAVGMIPTAAVIDGNGEAVTGARVEAFIEAPSTMGVAVTTLSDSLRSAGTAVGIMGTNGMEDEGVVEVVMVSVTVTVSTICRNWGLSGEERVEERREVRRKERTVRECMVDFQWNGQVKKLQI